jgi:hypothetical protein
MLVVVNAALLFAGKAAGAGIYPLSYIIVAQVQYPVDNPPGYQHFPGWEIRLELVPFSGGAGRRKYIQDILAGAAVRASVEPFLYFIECHNCLLCSNFLSPTGERTKVRGHFLKAAVFTLTLASPLKGEVY